MPDANRMTAPRVLRSVLESACLRKLCRNVLVKRAAESDVNRLGAPAYAQNWKVPFQRRLGHLQLEFGAPGFDLAELFDWPFAVIARVDVKISTAEHETVQDAEQRTNS